MSEEQIAVIHGYKDTSYTVQSTGNHALGEDGELYREIKEDHGNKVFFRWEKVEKLKTNELVELTTATVCEKE